MGDFAELNIRFRLKFDTPDEIIETLRYMALSSKVPVTLPKHDLFNTRKWDSMLGAYNDPSGAPVKVSILEKDKSDESWFILVRSVYKDRGEAKLFFNWVYPYIDAGSDSPDFIGFIKYDNVENPYLIYYTDQGMRFLKVCCDGEVSASWSIKDIT